MARNKIGLQFDGWEDVLSNLDKIGGGAAVKKATEKALEAAKDCVTQKIEQSIQKSNLPAQGKYSKGTTQESINRDSKTEWEGMTAGTDVGFNFDKSGMKSIYLMYGTPNIDPVKGLKNAIYGSKTRKEVAEKQEEIISKEIKKIMGG